MNKNNKEEEKKIIYKSMDKNNKKEEKKVIHKWTKNKKPRNN